MIQMKTFLLLLVPSVFLRPGLACDCTHPDFVQHLPGMSQPLPSPWWSGYLTYQLDEQRTVHTHYVLVQAEEETHTKKPLIYWSNGGPGASSMFGLFTEIGPLVLDDRSLSEYDPTTTTKNNHRPPKPIYNPYNWAKLGSILVFDQPAPVGFSYCNNDTRGHSCDGLAWNDELAAESTFRALQAFYTKFPCYKHRDLYLTGESYAGIYVPTLARNILQRDTNDNSTIPLKGFAVGDGCLGTQTSVCGDLADPDRFDIWPILFLAGHGQMPLATFQQVIRACGPGGVRKTPLCQAAIKKVHEQVGGFYEYSLYDECTYENGLLQGALNDYACGGDVVMEKYLGLPQVQEALHVKGTFFSVDNAEGDFDYTPSEPDLQPFYKSVNGKLKVLVYNGDVDPAITSFAAQNWTSHLGLEERESWRPWTVDGCRRMGGHVVRYEGMFDFLTIRGAGHMVPTYKGAATFTFLNAWINDEEYPTYNKNCSYPSRRPEILRSASESKV